MQIVELLTPEYEAAWLPWAVQYFFFIGIAATTALTAAVLAFGKSGSPAARLLPAAVVVLLVTAIAAPVSLLADLHQPGRFWHFYAHFTPWSWIDRKSTRLNSSHVKISYAVFCLKKKNTVKSMGFLW